MIDGDEMTKRHISIEPVHPGEVLREDAFPALRVTKPALAEALGVSRQTLYEIMSAKRAVTPEMAVRLEAVIGSTAETWLALQAERDLWEARQRVNVKRLKRLAAASDHRLRFRSSPRHPLNPGASCPVRSTYSV